MTMWFAVARVILSTEVAIRIEVVHIHAVRIRAIATGLVARQADATRRELLSVIT